MVKDKIVCKCRSVKYLDILKNIEDGYDNIENIMEITGATTCCGGCTSEVLTILKKAKENK